MNFRGHIAEYTSSFPWFKVWILIILIFFLTQFSKMKYFCGNLVTLKDLRFH